MTKIFPTLLLSLLVGCGTVTPDYVDDRSGISDSTTPSQYDPTKSGFCRRIRNADGRVVGALYTAKAIQRYHALLEDYRLQVEKSNSVKITPQDGITIYPQESDTLGDPLIFIDAEHLNYWMQMTSMRDNHIPTDSIWSKMKEKVTP